MKIIKHGGTKIQVAYTKTVNDRIDVCSTERRHLTDSSLVITLTLSNSIGESLMHKIFHTCFCLSLNCTMIHRTDRNRTEDYARWEKTFYQRTHQPYSKIYNIVIERQTFVYTNVRARYV